MIHRTLDGARFSPRARGCSAIHHCDMGIQRVFPACAGMFRRHHRHFAWAQGFPRVRGDVPPTPRLFPCRQAFSPRARGCSHFYQLITMIFTVFPACAGMFRTHWPGNNRLGCFPRVRGDVPVACHQGHLVLAFSPRARGCSRMGNHVQKGGIVFPCRGYSYQV